MLDRVKSNLLLNKELLPGLLTAFLFLLVLLLFIIPVAPGTLDILLGFNLGFSILLLVRALFIKKLSELYTFPALLLFSTVFRLSLNVSSTRLILSSGDTGLDAAGDIIGSLGKFAVGQDFFVGLVIFVIIALVNFLVIAKGSARVAEVAARFSLDALPGRQSEIEQAVRDGAMSRTDAVKKREELAKESRFLGSMDGAMKFVQGDAIVGLIIALINSFGGVGVGIYKGLGFSESVSLYGVLTVGDGLISVIPSLFVAVSAGLVVTHANDGKGAQAAQNLVENPLVSGLASVGTLLLGLLPGFPLIPFTLTALIFAGVCFLQARKATVEVSGNVELFVYLSPAEYESWRYELLENYDESRSTYGSTMPSLAVLQDDTLNRECFRVKAASALSVSAEAIDTSVYCVTDAFTIELFGGRVVKEVIDPIQKLPAAWILHDPGVLSSLNKIGVEVLTPGQFVGRFVTGFALENLESFWGLGEVKRTVEDTRVSYPHLVEEVFDSGLISYPEYAEVCRRLLKDGVMLQDQKVVMQGVAEYACQYQKDEDPQVWLEGLHRYVRKCLGFKLLTNCFGRELFLFSLSDETESKLKETSSAWYSNREAVPVSPSLRAGLLNSLHTNLDPILNTGNVPVVLAVEESIRELLQAFLSRVDRYKRSVVVLAQDEVVHGEEVLFLGEL